MLPENLLNAKNRNQLRAWLIENHKTENECRVVVKVLPDTSPSGFVIDGEILDALQADTVVWNYFLSFPSLYQRVRIDTIRIKKKQPKLFYSGLQKFIENTRLGITYGEWNDNGRLLNY